jgi:amino acid permease
MSERWKYQIKTGGIWGVFMSIFMILFNLKEASFSEQISKPEFFIRAAAYIVIGIFVLGYFTWKSKNKRENTK